MSNRANTSNRFPCPNCGGDSRVYRTIREPEFIVRERKCSGCGHPQRTVEIIDLDEPTDADGPVYVLGKVAKYPTMYDVETLIGFIPQADTPAKRNHLARALRIKIKCAQSRR